MTKEAILISLLLFQTTLVLGQEQEPSRIIAADSTWSSEFFEFPLGFAQEIDFKGLEEAIFPAGWGDEASPNFWTYAFAWKISLDKALTETDFEINLQYYFDGLLELSLAGNNKAPMPKTNALFVEKESSYGNTQYIGKIKTLDTRFTKRPMTLNVQVEQHYCPQTRQSVILFKFSPKTFESNVWLKLYEIKLRDVTCGN